VFQNVIGHVMAEYCATATMETFTASKNPRHLTEIARLAGARMVTASETEEGGHWSEVRIKQLTGGDKITSL
jgi:putative DNA primase/helicase